ncbi:hypothetical protein LCGC14_2522540 [marine sediment metagenome]|uniref:Uncharacterized protein n=1 Tax=marine sediment metagenome TaxID=412755 RepID=A0A0F9AVZ7_9ZZZZ
MVEKTNVTKWSIENIPDKDDLYYRMHKMYFEDNPNIIPGSGFRPQGESLSVDWNKHSTPEQSRQRATIPDDNRIVETNVGDVRAIPLIVIHNPDHARMNRAHTDILGLIGVSKSELNKLRSQLATLSDWAI